MAPLAPVTFWYNIDATACEHPKSPLRDRVKNVLSQKHHHAFLLDDWEQRLSFPLVSVEPFRLTSAPWSSARGLIISGAVDFAIRSTYWVPGREKSDRKIFMRPTKRLGVNASDRWIARKFFIERVDQTAPEDDPVHFASCVRRWPCWHEEWACNIKITAHPH